MKKNRFSATALTRVSSSSIGFAKAALEAVNGINLFGDRGANWSVAYVDIDAHNRNRSIFETLLPRESASKSVDAALLPTVSFPAFATHDKVRIITIEVKKSFKNIKRKSCLDTKMALKSLLVPVIN